MSKFYVRFNIRHGGSGLVWRVFEDGVEHLATDVRILGETYTQTSRARRNQMEHSLPREDHLGGSSGCDSGRQGLKKQKL